METRSIREILCEPAELDPFIAQTCLDLASYTLDIPLRLYDQNNLFRLYDHIVEFVEYRVSTKHSGIDAVSGTELRELLKRVASSESEFTEKAHNSARLVKNLYYEAVEIEGFKSEDAPPTRIRSSAIIEREIRRCGASYRSQLSHTLFDSPALKLAESLISDIERRIWRTLPSNPIPIQYLFRLTPLWRWNVLLWLYTQPKIEDTWTLRTNAYGFQPLHSLSTQWAGINGNHVIKIGPEFMPTNKLLVRHYHDKYVAPALTAYQLLGVCAPHVHVYPSRSRLAAVAHQRLPRTTQSVRSHGDKLIRILNKMLNADVPANFEPLHRHDLRMALSWIIFHDRQKHNYQSRSEHNNLVLRLEHRQTTESAGFIGSSPANKDNIHFFNSTKGLTGPPIRLCTEDGKIEGEPNEEELEKFQAEFTSLLRRADSVTQLQYSQRLVQFSGWLNDRFGSMNMGPDEIEGDRAIGPSVETTIARWVGEYLRANRCNLYRYNASDRTLGLVATWSIDGIDEQFRDSTRRYVKNLGNDGATGSTNRIPLYRVVDERRIMFIRHKSDSTPSFYPYEEEGHRLACRTVILSPIRFNGRVIGVVEVGAIGIGQFRWSNQHLLGSVASQLGAYLYKHQLFDALSGAQSRLLDYNTSEHKDDEANGRFYDAICDELCKAFACHSAALWKCDSTNTNAYICMGLHNREESIRDSIFFRDDSKYVSASLLNASSDIHTVAVVRTDNSVQLHYRDKCIECPEPLADHITKNNILQISILLIRPKVGDERKPIATVSLYSRSRLGHNVGWNGIIQVIGEFLRVSVESADVVHRRELLEHEQMQHEIRQDVRLLSTRSLRAASLADRLASRLLKKDIDENAIAQERNRLQQVVREVRVFRDDALRLIEKRKDESEPIMIDVLSGLANTVRSDPGFNKAGLHVSREKHFNRVTDTNRDDYGVLIRESEWLKIADNLATNAVKYALHGSKIEIEFHVKAEYGFLQILNSGLRISIEDQKNLFVPWRRGQDAKNSKIPGDGMGLYIAQQAAMRSGLSLDYETDDQGNERHFFILDIPIEKIGKF